MVVMGEELVVVEKGDIEAEEEEEEGEDVFSLVMEIHAATDVHDRQLFS